MVWELLSSCWGWFWPSSSSSSNKNKYKKKKKKKALDDSSCIKLRVGWAGKDILIDSVDLNVRAIARFGQYAVLIDFKNKEVIPLTTDGFPSTPLKRRARYVVEVNTHGSDSPKQTLFKPRFPPYSPGSPSFPSKSYLSPSSPHYRPSSPPLTSPPPSLVPPLTLSPSPSRSAYLPGTPRPNHTHTPTTSSSLSSSSPLSSSINSISPSLHFSHHLPFSNSPLRFSTSLNADDGDDDDHDETEILSDYEQDDHEDDGHDDKEKDFETKREKDPVQQCIDNINGAIMIAEDAIN